MTTSTHSFPIAYAACARNDALRQRSASGAVFPCLALHVLQQGGVVFGAAWDDDFTVRHIGIEAETDLWKLQSAKYAQSHLGGVYQQVQSFLSVNRMVLFSGTPCQIAGLKKFLGQDYAALWCVDTICHGTPLEKPWLSYLNWRVQQDGKQTLPCHIHLRKKVPDWSNYGYSLSFTYPDGTETLSHNKQDLFMRGFVGDYFLRESCYSCPHKGENRASDITLGDFWGIWATHPEMDDHQGTSAVIIHTEKGQRMWDAIAGELRTLAVPLSDITDHNPCYLRPVPKNAKREQVLADLEHLPFDQVMESVLPKEKVVRFKLLHRIMGKIKRIAKRILFR